MKSSYREAAVSNILRADLFGIFYNGTLKKALLFNAQKTSHLIHQQSNVNRKKGTDYYSIIKWFIMEPQPFW